jgi:thioredoxin-dependent peroxiredoxin
LRSGAGSGRGPVRRQSQPACASDVEKTAVTAYDTRIEQSMYGRKYMGMERSSFLVDKTGKIAKVWRKASVTGHAAEVMEAAKALGQ